MLLGLWDPNPGFKLCKLLGNLEYQVYGEIQFLVSFTILLFGNLGLNQYDQIGRFIGLWATFQTCGNNTLPKSPTFLGSFCNGVKICNFSSKIIFWASFVDIWQLFIGHTGLNLTFLTMLDFDVNLMTFLLQDIHSKAANINQQIILTGFHSIDFYANWRLSTPIPTYSLK